MHLDTAGYSDARVGYATSPHPEGPYEYVGGERPLGNESRDIGVFQEGDAAFLLSEDRRGGLRIYQLRPDYLGVQSLIATLHQQDRPELGYESPTLVRHHGVYYIFGSDLTGWEMNDNKYATAPDIAGPWGSWRDLAVPVAGDQFVYVGDRWNPEQLEPVRACDIALAVA